MRLHYTSWNACWKRFLSPQVWKEAHQEHQPGKKPSRWDLRPLLWLLLLMTWCTGHSENERFETARAFYIACHQQQKRPGQNLQGLSKALARLPLPVLHILFAGVRRRLQQAFARYWRSDGFLVMGCDGSRLECPRSKELEKRLGSCGKPDSAPMLMVSALVLLPVGLLWSWAVGPGDASEHELLLRQLARLPRRTLLVADAFYQGYDLYTAMLRAKLSFLVRVSSRSHLYLDRDTALERFREGVVWYWPKQARAKQRPPLLLRLIRVRGAKKKDVWLLTNVLERERLGRRRAAEIYRWRWGVEGVFKTYKRTLPKIKLWSRTEKLVYREAEVSLLGLQLLLAQAVSIARQDGAAMLVMGSARVELLRIRAVITTTIGERLGARQRRWYRERLAQIQEGGPGRKVRRQWPRRKQHKPPKPPKIHRLCGRLKARITKWINAASCQ
jgi:hypothetical protein